MSFATEIIKYNVNLYTLCEIENPSGTGTLYYSTRQIKNHTEKTQAKIISISPFSRSSCDWKRTLSQSSITIEFFDHDREFITNATPNKVLGKSVVIKVFCLDDSGTLTNKAVFSGKIVDFDIFQLSVKITVADKSYSFYDKNFGEAANKYGTELMFPRILSGHKSKIISKPLPIIHGYGLASTLTPNYIAPLVDISLTDNDDYMNCPRIATGHDENDTYEIDTAKDWAFLLAWHTCEITDFDALMALTNSGEVIEFTNNFTFVNDKWYWRTTGTQLITYGDMETSGKWIAIDGDATVTRDNTQKKAGTYATKVVTTTGDTGAKMLESPDSRVDITTGKEYCLTFWGYAASEQAMYVRGLVDGSIVEFTTDVIPLNNSWKLYRVYFTAANTGKLNILFNAYTTSKTFWIDECKMYEVLSHDALLVTMNSSDIMGADSPSIFYAGNIGKYLGAIPTGYYFSNNMQDIIENYMGVDSGDINTTAFDAIDTNMSTWGHNIYFQNYYISDKSNNQQLREICESFWLMFFSDWDGKISVKEREVGGENYDGNDYYRIALGASVLSFTSKNTFEIKTFMDKDGVYHPIFERSWYSPEKDVFQFEEKTDSPDSDAWSYEGKEFYLEHKNCGNGNSSTQINEFVYCRLREGLAGVDVKTDHRGFIAEIGDIIDITTNDGPGTGYSAEKFKIIEFQNIDLVNYTMTIRASK